jgi:hypothetical protein
MPILSNTPATRTDTDPNTGVLRGWFDDSTPVQAAKSFVPRTLARTTLADNAHLFQWQPQLPDLVDGSLLQGQGNVSVRFAQHFKGVPVDASEVVVNIHDDARVYSIYNQYHYDIPAILDPKKIKIDKVAARDLVERLAASLERRKISEPTLIVYQYHHVLHVLKHGTAIREQQGAHVLFNAEAAAIATGPAEEGTYFLAWDVRLTSSDPTRNIRVLIDSATGRLIQAIDMLQYAAGTGQVFDPNPIVTSGNTGLSSSTPIATLDAQRSAVTLDRLDAAIGGNLRLHGSFVQMEELASPAVAEPTSATGDFSFSYSDAHFLNTMAYFHIDRFQNYVQTMLGLNNVANFSIHVDAQGVSGDDNSFYDPSSKKLQLGGGITPPPAGNPVPDAGDAMVILHEYGHAIQDNVNPGFDNPAAGTGEGFGDFLAAVFYDTKHANPANTRGIMMSFDANTTDHSWTGRRYDVNWTFGDANYNAQNESHYHGQFWAASTFELYRKLGGDSVYPWVKSAACDLAIRLHLMANFNVPASGSTGTQMAQQIQAADSNLGGWRYANGLHKKVIFDTFRRRALPSFPALASDVFINDGRNGGYGSITGNDAFNEKLFLDNYWSTQDLWVKVAPYANSADQQAGDPGDHVEPITNQLAYLYVRVKNKGTTGSGPVTVKAYHSDPTIGLVWPADWTPTNTASDTVADIPAGGRHTFGPFPWTPTHVGHECVFAIAECANDRAITQDLQPTDLVSHADLVPFDNNIAQRNLAPTASKGKMVRGFWVSNPTFERAAVKLHFESTLPQGWRYTTNLASTEAIHLAPRERRWVEATIDQGSGVEVTDFANPPRLDVSGSIGGKLIGGMSFYVAPDSAFPGHTKPTAPCDVKPHDLMCLNIPWKDCEIEGEIEMKLRFRCDCAHKKS